jgi:hypothetical protein
MTQQKQIRKAENDIIFFIEKYCYIKDKKTNECRRIKLSKAQKMFIKHLSKLQKNK